MRVVGRAGRVLVVVLVALVATAGAALAWAGMIGPAAPPDGGVVKPFVECGHRHAEPVIVLPGGDGTVDQTHAQWKTVTDAIRAAGSCPLVFQAGVVDGKRWAGNLPNAARELGIFVATVREETKEPRVSLVAHSAASMVANYYLKVLGGAGAVRAAVFVSPETGRCDGAGFAAATGWPFSPFPLFDAVPAVPALLSQVLPGAAGPLQYAPGSRSYSEVFGGELTRPGVHYSVLATRNDRVATPAGTCSFIDEPGVVNDLYEDVFPTAPPVDHSSIRSSPHTAEWVVGQLGTGTVGPGN